MQRTFIAAAFALSLAAACGQNEVANSPAAEIQETTATDTTATASSSTPSVAVDVVKEKSSIKFTASNPVTTHEGAFQNFTGRAHFAGANAQGIEFDVDTASVKTDAEKLDGHLKSPDFFDVAKFPKATFKSTSITPASGQADGATHEVTGTLNMHGVEKTIKFPAKVQTTPEGLHATSEFSIDRNDWGIVYKGAPDKIIRDEVQMKIDLWFPPAPQS